MINNKKSKSTRYHKFLQTKHVLVEENHAYLKKDTLDAEIFDEPLIQWFPVRIQSGL